MYVIDYNTKLAHNRDNYYKTAKKQKERYEEQLGANNEANKVKSQKQLKAHQNYILDLTDANEQHLAETTNRANQLVLQRESDTRKLLRNMREDFREDTSDIKRDYNRKLGNISDSYDNTSKEQKRHFDNTTSRIKRNSFNNMNKQKRQNLEELDRFTRSAENTLKETKRDMKRDNTNLLKRFQNEKEDILRNSSERELRNRNNFNKRLQEIQGIFKNELEFINDKNKVNLETARKKDTSALDNLTTTFGERLNNLTDKFEYELGDLRHKNSLETQKMQRDHRSEIQAKGQQARDKIKIIGGKEKHDQETRKMIEKYEHRLGKLRTEMRDEGVKRMRHLETSEQDLRDEIMDQNLEHKEYIGRLNEVFDDVTHKKVERSRKEQTKTKDSFREKIRILEGDHEREIIHANRLSEVKLKNQNKILNKSLQNFSEKNIKNSEKMQEAFNRERNIIKLDSEKKLSEDVANAKTNLEQKIEKVVSSYEYKLDIQDVKMNQKQEKYERKIDYLEDVIRNKEKEHKTFERETRIDDRREMEDRLKEQQKDFSISNKRVRKKFDTYMRDIEKKNKRSSEKIVRGYEKELSDRNIENQRKLKRVKGKFRMELNKVSKDAKNERESLILSFEEKIKNMRDIYNENVEMFKEIRSRQLMNSVE